MLYAAEQLTWENLRRLSSEGVPIVLPSGALEQHGPHLPTKVDSFLVGEVCRAAAEQVDRELVLLPTLWVGASDHHTPFFAASLDETTYSNVVVNLARSVSFAGFRKFIVINGHGGNAAPLRVAMTTVRQHLPEVWGIAVEYWSLAAAGIADLRVSSVGGMAHAGEFETSLMQFLSPEEVKDSHVHSSRPDVPEQLRPDLLDAGPASSSLPWTKLTDNGTVGDPDSADPARGREFFGCVVGAVSEFLHSVCDYDPVQDARNT